MALKYFTALSAAAAGLALMAGPALAAAPYVVTYDGNAIGTYTVVFTNKAPVVFAAGGAELTCADSTLTVNVTAGTYTSDPADIGTIDPATFTDCDFDGFPVTVTAHTPWQLIADGGNTPGTMDTISGVVTGFDVSASIDGPLGTCSAEVTGSDGDEFLEDNGKGGQELDAIPGPGLTISNIDNALTCVDLINNGDPASFAGQYNSDNQAIQVS